MNGQPVYLPDGLVLMVRNNCSGSIRPGEFDIMTDFITDDKKKKIMLSDFGDTLCCNVHVKLTSNT